MVEDFVGANWTSSLSPWPIAPLEDRFTGEAPVILFYNGEDDVLDFHTTAEGLASL